MQGIALISKIGSMIEDPFGVIQLHSKGIIIHRTGQSHSTIEKEEVGRGCKNGTTRLVIQYF